MFLAPYTLLFALYLFLKTVNGQASTYYFYKIHFLLWLIALVLVYYAVVYAEKADKGIDNRKLCDVGIFNRNVPWQDRGENCSP